LNFDEASTANSSMINSLANSFAVYNNNTQNSTSAAKQMVFPSKGTKLNFDFSMPNNGI